MTSSIRPALILHGGGGPATVAGIAAHLDADFRVIAPTHPGWNGVERPDDVDSVAAMARGYLDDLSSQGLTDVLVIGSSLGGWIAAEMASQDADSRLTGLVLIDAAGIEVPEFPMRDFFALDPRGVAEYSFHDAERFFRDPATIPPEQQAAQRANMATMRIIAGDPYMHDPTLRARLAAIAIPTLVVWGESDRIFTPGYGRTYAEAFGDARFELVERAGHLPQLEQPDALSALLDGYVAAGR